MPIIFNKLNQKHPLLGFVEMKMSFIFYFYKKKLRRQSIQLSILQKLQILKEMHHSKGSLYVQFREYFLFPVASHSLKNKKEMKKK